MKIEIYMDTTYQEVRNVNNMRYLPNQDINPEVDNTLTFLYQQMPPLIRSIAQAFEDPSGKGRKMVVICIDATYVYFEKPEDPELQKLIFCSYKGYTFKIIIIS